MGPQYWNVVNKSVVVGPQYWNVVNKSVVVGPQYWNVALSVHYELCLSCAQDQVRGVFVR